MKNLISKFKSTFLYELIFSQIGICFFIMLIIYIILAHL